MNFNVPKRLFNAILSIIKHFNIKLQVDDLYGDRDIEWSWIASNLPAGSGNALDFGCGISILPIITARKGYHVTAIDLEPIEFPYHHQRLKFIQGDLLELDLQREYFDVIVNCSTVEHVGLVGRYGVKKPKPNGDVEAMIRLSDLIKQDGVMFLTIPVGLDSTFEPLHRVYGKERLPHLLNQFMIIKQDYWVKKARRVWVECDKETALNFEPSKHLYALGLFELKKKIPPS